MAQKTKSQLANLYGTNGSVFPSVAGAVSAEDFRAFGQDLIDSLLAIDEADDAIVVVLTGHATGSDNAALTTGVKKKIYVPFDCTILGWDAVADQTGSIVVDIWNKAYASLPATVSDTIAGTEKITISSGIKGQDLTLTTWTTSLTKGTWLYFNVDSVTSIHELTIALRVKRIK